MNRLISYLEF